MLDSPESLKYKIVIKGKTNLRCADLVALTYLGSTPYETDAKTEWWQMSSFSESALPDVLVPRVGPEGINAWVKYTDATWELSNVDAAPVAGLKPGCVMMRMTFDVKHKTTGKEAHGVRMYNELAYNAAGQYVYARHYYVNAPLLASIY